MIGISLDCISVNCKDIYITINVDEPNEFENVLNLYTESFKDLKVIETGCLNYDETDYAYMCLNIEKDRVSKLRNLCTIINNCPNTFVDMSGYLFNPFEYGYKGDVDLFCGISDAGRFDDSKSFTESVNYLIDRYFNGEIPEEPVSEDELVRRGQATL